MLKKSFFKIPEKKQRFQFIKFDFQTTKWLLDKKKVSQLPRLHNKKSSPAQSISWFFMCGFNIGLRGGDTRTRLRSLFWNSWFQAILGVFHGQFFATTDLKTIQNLPVMVFDHFQRIENPENLRFTRVPPFQNNKLIALWGSTYQPRGNKNSGNWIDQTSNKYELCVR